MTDFRGRISTIGGAPDPVKEPPALEVPGEMDFTKLSPEMLAAIRKDPGNRAIEDQKAATDEFARLLPVAEAEPTLAAISLRDHIAIEAMKVLLGVRNNIEPEKFEMVMSIASYRMADGMLAARKRSAS
jgi:hypothetical protein